MSTPSKTTSSKSAPSKTTAKPAAKVVPKKTSVKPAMPTTKPAKPVNLSDLDSMDESQADKELAKMLSSDDSDEDSFEDDEDADGLDANNDPSDGPSDSSDEDSISSEDVGAGLTPSALIDRLSHDSASESKPPESTKDSTVLLREAKPFELPPCLDTEDSTQNASGIKLVLETYAPGCLGCSHLVPSADTEYTDCHYTAGNVFCPAQSVKIIFTGRRNVFLNKLKTARASGDSNRVLKILASLEKEPIDLKNYVLSKSGII